MNCPHCGKDINAGKLLGSLKSQSKSAAAKLNGAKGGRPRKGEASSPAIAQPEAIKPITATKSEGHKCHSEWCFSVQTKLYQRPNGSYWLCDAHQP